MNHVVSTELKTTTEQSETVDLRTGEVLPAPPNITAVAEQLVAAARGQGIELTGPNGLLTGLTRQVLQSALEAELTEHLGYDPGDRVGKQTPNSRNGSTPKTVRTEIGDLTIQVPRDRAGTFAPVVVPKHQRRIAGFDEAVISLYANRKPTTHTATGPNEGGGPRRPHDPRGFTLARMLVAEDITVGRGEPAGEGQRVPTEATVPRRSTTQLSSVSALSRSSHAPSASTRTRVIAATMCAVQAVARAATDAASRSGRAASTPRCIAAASSSR